MDSCRIIYISPSQVSTFRLCRRKWWLEKVAKAVKRDKGYLDFGTVLHGVVERWLMADDRGVDPKTGQPVELYPPDWDKVGDSGVRMTTDQAALIRELVKQAIEKGILKRQPGREIEVEMNRTLEQGEDWASYITGRIDLLLPDGVEDHKTTKNWRYAKSARELQKDPQLLAYCGELVMRALDEGRDPPERMTVQHNVFGKDPDAPRVGSTPAWVALEDVLRNWSEMAADARRMMTVREVGSWQEIAGPEPGTNGCRAFGGCDFQRLCSGELSLEEVNRANSSLSGDRLHAALARSPERTNEDQMPDTLKDLMAKRAAANAGASKPAAPAPAMNSGGGVAAPAAPAASAPAPAAAPAAPAQPAEKRKAPWYDEGCVTCTSNLVPGFSSKGTPCRICDSNRKKKGLETSDAYEIVPGATLGEVTWKRRDGAAAPATATVATPPAVKVDPPKPAAEPAPPAPPKSTPEVTPQVAAPAPAAAEEPASDAAPSEDNPTGRGRGRPKTGFFLLQGARPGKGWSGKVTFLSEVVAAHANVVAQSPAFGGSAEKPVDFWTLDPFRRSDAIAAQAPVIAEALGAGTLVIDSDGIEARRLVDALRAYPCREVVGVTR